MKFKDINRIYTQTVMDWLSRGYTINTGTMARSQSAFACTDFTDGKEVYRVALDNFSDEYTIGINWIGLIVGCCGTVKPNKNDRAWETVRNSELEMINITKFYVVADLKNGDAIYGTYEEAMEAQDKRSLRRPGCFKSPMKEISNPRAISIAKKYIKRVTGKRRINESLIRVRKNVESCKYYISYDGKGNELH